jgi:hypothetical protein
MNNLKKNNFTSSIGFLPWIDVYSLRLANPRLPIKQSSIIKIIIERLKIMGIDIIEAIKKNKAIISGSFILQCIYGVIYPGSDVDIYIIGENSDTTEWTKQSGWTEDWKFMYDITKNHTYDKTKTITANPYPIMPIVSRTYIFDDIKLNYILIDPKFKSISEFILKYFDISICKVMFNGERLYIHNLNDIITRSFSIDRNTTKYIRVNRDEREIDDIIQTRVNKYTKRGFKKQI